MNPHRRLLVLGALLTGCDAGSLDAVDAGFAVSGDAEADATGSADATGGTDVTGSADATSSTDVTTADRPRACPMGPAVMARTVPAFPGAEGFGATATGGRGGGICAVTTLASSGVGSLARCLQTPGARTVVFRVSGVINGPLDLTRGAVTIAGQTSPGGIIVRGGLRCDNVYDPNDCRNVILRHLRLRGSNDDALRLSGAQRVIVDHVSFANANDENLEISRSQDITLQYSVIAEPLGDHFRYGGVLINYSKDRFPLANLSLHHNVWNGVHGRLPEISCEDNPDGPGTSNCSGRRLRVEVSHNLFFDVSDPVYYNRCTGTNEGNDCARSARNFVLDLNFVGNVMARRASLPELAIFAPEVSRGANALFWADNTLTRQGRTTAATLALPSQAARHDFPALTATPGDQLVALLRREAGAFPRDAMDTRLEGYLGAPVDQRPPAWNSSVGIDRGDAFRVAMAPPPPADTDGDGIPDAWERAHGLSPECPNAQLGILAANPANGVEGCVPGYSDLECYLNELAARRVAGM